MPRPPTYDRAQVLRQAMAVFRRYGFRDTSISRLTEATGLRPGSLYGAFGNKRALYEQALDHYCVAALEDFRGILQTPGSARARLQAFFDYLVQDCIADIQGQGCLMVNALLETPVSDAPLNQRITAVCDALEREFKQVLRDGREQSELVAGRPVQAQAQMLVSLMYGLRAYAKAHRDADSLRGITSTALDGLFERVD